MLMGTEVTKVKESKRNGLIISVYHRTGEKNLPHRRRVDTGKVLSEHLDKLILERVRSGGAVSINKDRIIIIS